MRKSDFCRLTVAFFNFKLWNVKKKNTAITSPEQNRDTTRAVHFSDDRENKGDDPSRGESLYIYLPVPGDGKRYKHTYTIRHFFIIIIIIFIFFWETVAVKLLPAQCIINSIITPVCDKRPFPRRHNEFHRVKMFLLIVFYE